MGLNCKDLSMRAGRTAGVGRWVGLPGDCRDVAIMCIVVRDDDMLDGLFIVMFLRVMRPILSCFGM